MSKHRRKSPGFVRLLALTLVMTAFLRFENDTLQTQVYPVRLTSLPQAFSGLRILQLSDLHGKAFGQNSQTLLQAVKDAQPDIIAITGDLADGRTEFSTLRPLLRALCAIAPTFYVTGNHEWALADRQALFDLIEDSGVVWLRNSYRVLQKDGESLVLAGADDPNGPADQKTPAQLLQDIRESCGEDACVVLLYHRNDQLPLWQSLGADLVLSGHAHGGVVRIPGVGGVFGTGGDLFPDFTTGAYQAGDTTMVVSRGLGSVPVLPLRIFNRPQLPLIILNSK